MTTQIKTIVEEKEISFLETSHEQISKSENPEDIQTKLKNLIEASKAAYVMRCAIW